MQECQFCNHVDLKQIIPAQSNLPSRFVVFYAAGLFKIQQPEIITNMCLIIKHIEESI